jgi:DNA-binding NtrC family response regulator
VRELENVVRRVLALRSNRSSRTITADDLPDDVLGRVLQRATDSELEARFAAHFLAKAQDGRLGLTEILDVCERLILQQALARTEGNQSKAAQLLGTTRRTIFNKIVKHDLHSTAGAAAE